jgi:polysaccharide pyruvyl transferase WcaK-like protein
MLVCLNQWLKKQNIEVTVIADDADSVTRQHALPAVQNHPFLGQFSWVDSLLRGKAFITLKALYRTDLVMAGGGDVIRDEIGWRTFTFQVEKLVAGLLMGKPVYLLNVGLSTPATAYGRFTLKWLLPRLRGMVVRDTRSVEISASYGVTRRVVLLPDIVRRLPELMPEAARTPGDRTTVLVALHGDSNVYRRYQMTDERLAAFAGMLDTLAERYGLEIEFFPFQPAQDGGDARIARRVQSLMQHAGRSRILEWTVDVGELAARLSRSRLVIAMRLHAAVLAATYSAPCILMPYDQKVVEFGKQAEIPHILTPEILDKPEKSRQFLENVMANLVAPAALPPAADWLTLTLDSL